MFPTFFLPAPSAALDPSMILLLLHFEETWTDGTSTYVVDSSSYAVDVYIVNGTLTTAQQKFGSKSWVASGDYANVRPKEYLDGQYRVDNRDWCMEGWFRHPSGDFGNGMFFTIGHPSFVDRMICSFESGNNVYVRQWQASSPAWVLAGTFPVDTWFHFAVVRHSGKVKMYINGVLQQETAADAFVCAQASPQLEIVGNIGNIGDGPDGYIDEVRVVMGDAVYYDEFTPPTAAFPDV